MVVGAYFPELSGGALQIRQLIRALGPRVRCAVLTTSAVASPGPPEVDGVLVRRVYVDVRSRRSIAGAGVRLAGAFLRMAPHVDIVQLNGYSRKSVLLMVLATAFRKRCVIKLTSVGQDDPPAIRAQGRLAFASYMRADAFVGLNPRQRELCLASGIVPERFTLIPNGVDLARFRPPVDGEREQLRATLGLPKDQPLTLFVGFFSREKQPHVLFEAWRRLPRDQAGALVFVGATGGTNYEIDPGLADEIRRAASTAGVADRLTFVERSDRIEDYYRAADVFAMPSTREGLPNALLEAMASGLPCVASRLPGVTDWFVGDGASGLLVPPGDVDALSAALTRALGDARVAAALGRAARAVVQQRFDFDAIAGAYADLYARLLGCTSSVSASSRRE
jgi:glycosyltransferase involved in cell wall biosynthesis